MKGWFRNVGAGVAGYVAMFAVAFVLFSGVWLVLGAEGSFRSGTWEISGAWAAASIALGLIVNVSGGFTTAKLASDARGIATLVFLVVALGVIAALPEAGATPAARPDGATMFDAMSNAIQPRWMLWMNPAWGAFGVLLGGFLATRRGLRP